MSFYDEKHNKIADICEFGDENNELEEIFRDTTIDPTYDNNIFIIVAAECGHVDVVKRLLKCENVNPSAQNNLALRMAIQNNHSEVVSLIQSDHRYKNR